MFCAGKSCVLHIHTAAEEVVVERIVSELDKKTGKEKPSHKVRPEPRVCAGGAVLNLTPCPFMSRTQPFVLGNSACVAQLRTTRTVCLEKFETMQQLGRFTLRDAGRTLAIGKVTKLPRSAVEAASGAAAGAGSGAGAGAGSGH